MLIFTIFQIGFWRPPTGTEPSTSAEEADFTLSIADLPGFVSSLCRGSLYAKCYSLTLSLEDQKVVSISALLGNNRNILVDGWGFLVYKIVKRYIY